jgi:hypothetical protein
LAFSDAFFRRRFSRALTVLGSDPLDVSLSPGMAYFFLFLGGMMSFDALLPTTPTPGRVCFRFFRRRPSARRGWLSSFVSFWFLYVP